ncbi:endocuticle structural glycoprotein SgAbd-2 [Scaptodrosophila lebanonensis]|uniref:Endocuticle structural glycoprotein SgAbd-2 n=1 Tax=Drosophila lebanonensis TaxID=7225 RepID=A0A6J2UK33_DROLE|nr:endocuticle structural glycoprotein SgAbd-2 [Scaptodrosophila lebanonensis]
MSLKALSCLIVLACVLISCHAQRQYNPYLSNPYYRDLYYKNRDLYNQRRFYDNFYKQYNPNVANVQARIVDQLNTPNSGSGVYSYSYETENGIHGEERGAPLDIGNGEQEEQVAGSYSYITPEGLRVGVTYVADANGYRPIITYDGVNSALYARQQAPASVALTKH